MKHVPLDPRRTTLRLAALALCLCLAGLAACGGRTSGISATPAAATPPGTAAAPLPESEAAFGEPAATIHFTHLGVEAGLSQSSINSILQDRQGFMWFGTQDGLDRYDGYHFKVYRPDPADPSSLSDRWITALYEDGAGILWVGTRLGGLDRFDPATGQSVRFMHSAGDARSLSSNYVTSLYEDSDGLLWVGTEEGLDRYLPASNGFEHYDLNLLVHSEDVSYFITSLLEDPDGTLWAGSTFAGLSRYDRSQDKFVSQPNRTDRPAANLGNVHAIQPAGKQALWLATEQGLVLFDPASGVIARYQNSPGDPSSLASNMILALYRDRGGNLWIGTDAGLDRFQPSTGHFIHYSHNSNSESSLSSSTITAIYESRDSVLWVGTYGGGLNKYYRGQDRFASYSEQPGSPSSLGGNLVFKIQVDADQKAWLSIYGGGVDRLDPQNGLVTHLRNDPGDPGSLASDEVWSVYTDREGSLWVGTSLGLDRRLPGTQAFTHYRYDPAAKAFAPLPADPIQAQGLAAVPVYDILEDSRGDVWFATEAGLGCYQRSTGTFHQYQHNSDDPGSLSGNPIVNLFLDRAGSLWVGTFYAGLDHFEAASGTFTHFQHDPERADSLSNDSVLSIFQDSRGSLWVGTDGGGLNRYDDKTNSFGHYFESDGLPSNVVNGILEDDQGYLWLSTNNGLSRFHPQTGTFRNYTVRDGLQGDEFDMNAYARDASGRLYFGGVNGLTVFHPEAITDSPFVPPIQLVSVTQDGLPLKLGRGSDGLPEIDLRWPNNNFEFEFVALSYADPERNLYAYRLENFDPNWNQIGTWRDGRYTNLPGGTYTLRLKGSNQDEVWNEAGLSVRVVVVPPFWRTAWFLVTASACLLGLVFGGYWLRLRSVRANNRELERQVRDRTREIERLFEKTKELAVVEERNRLARELHDSAKQKAFAALAQLGTAGGLLAASPQKAKSHLDEAENLVYEVIEDLTFLIQEMYPLALKEKGLATSLREYIFEWESRIDTRLDLHIENEKRLRLEIEQAVYRIVQEALSNVARHSRATHVDVSLTYSPRLVEACVADNGCGFDPASRPAGIGLRSIQERAESLGGRVEIQSAPGQGTRLTACIPLAAKRKSRKGESHV